ncbi:hypothetical protein JCM18909_1562 [Cutibacterium acnes JCM 18909]|nr:hypothetical protein JCM18909_1562 [Cutibacterium acnes JCM 18909]
MAQLSRDTGIEYVTLGRYLRGQRDMSISVVYRCALHWAVSVESLVHEAGQKMGWTVE